MSGHTPTFRRGVNLSHFLSQIRKGRSFPDKDMFRPEDAVWIAARGYDHVRLPVDGRELPGDDGALREDTLSVLDEAWGWCRDAGLGVILDLHFLPGADFTDRSRDARLYTDSVMQERAANIWQQLARHYEAKAPDLWFELLNEPVAEDPEPLNQLYRVLIPAIREVSPDRTILVSSNRWGSFRTVKDLADFGDPNVIVTFHYYEPFVFTHQEAAWTELGRHGIGGIPFPGKVRDLSNELPPDSALLEFSGAELSEEQVTADIDSLARLADQRGWRLYLGEFGAYKAADPDYRMNWYRTVVSAAENHGIPWAVWDFQGGFAVRHPETREPTVVQEALDPFLQG